MNHDVSCTGDSILIKCEPQWQYNDGDEIDNLSIPLSNINENVGIQCEEEEEMLDISWKEDSNGSLVQQEVAEEESKGPQNVLIHDGVEHHIEYKEELLEGVTLRQEAPTNFMCNFDNETEVVQGGSALHIYPGDISIPPNGNEIVVKQEILPPLPVISSPPHTGENPYKCDKCPYTTADSSHFVVHTCTHTGEKPHRCDKCPYAAARADTLVRHKRKHTGEKPYRCDKCPYAAVRHDHLVEHKRKHTREKNYRCDNTCPYAAAQAGHLVEHKRTHTGGKPYRCDKCPYAAAWASDLVIHNRTHTREKPYRCDKCPYAAAQAGNLVQHKRKHTGEKPYRCDKCPYAATRGGDLVKHKRTHTGEKPYQCDKCPHATARAGDLVKHKCTHTGEKHYNIGPFDASLAGLLVEEEHRHSAEMTHRFYHCFNATEVSHNFASTKSVHSHAAFHTKQKPNDRDQCPYSSHWVNNTMTYTRR